MEQKLPELCRGTVRIQIKGNQVERFLNLCSKREIYIRNLEYEGKNLLTGVISLADFFRLKPLCRKTGTRIHILKRKGFPFLVLRSRKRKSFCLGILLCVLLLWFLSSHIWNIHVEGNVHNSTESILSFLGEKGITHGIAGKKINCGAVAAAVREHFPDITWVSVRREGSRLILQIKEGIFAEQQNKNKQTACDLRADQDGTIVKMITRAGVPRMKMGDLCKKGDILISGCQEIQNDDQEITGYHYIHAEGEIYIKTSRAYYRESPLEYKKEVPDGREKRGFYIKIGGWYLETAAKRSGNWNKTTEEIPVYLTESFRLPVSFGKITLYSFQEKKIEDTEKEAKEKARRALEDYEEKLMEKGVQISANNVKIDVDHKTCISKGSLEIIQKTGTESPVEKLGLPAERTAEDD